MPRAIRRLTLLLAGPAVVLLPSCGLVQAPFRVAGGLVNATAEVTAAAVEAPIEGHRKRKARREEPEIETRAGPD